MFKNIENFLRKKYQPKEAPWKRKILFFLSLGILVGCLVSGFTQYYHHFTNDGIWIVIILFSFISLIGLLVSVFSKDFWVALVLGSV